MAKFKLLLLNPYADNNSASFLSNTISNFTSPDQLYEANKEDTTIINHETNACYSFNEHFSIHANSQKELTFDMLEKCLIYDDLTDNPFVNLLHIGTQLCLIDQYNNQHLFTIKSITFKPTKDNVTYSYTCQDTFTYQLIRQNSGYNLENDAESTNFIGAKSIDWWVVNKIQPECYITYSYLPLEQGLYIDTTGVYHFYTINDILTNVDKIIKPIYSKDAYSNLFETFPFSCSGSNGSAALIALGEQLGLELETFEHQIINTNNYYRLYWFRPNKNKDVTGLTYSPNLNVNNYNFSFNGENLTSILNVSSTTVNEQEIGLFPELPGVFADIFSSNSWNYSQYLPNFFTETLNGNQLKSIQSEPLFNNFKLIPPPAITTLQLVPKDLGDSSNPSYYYLCEIQGLSLNTLYTLIKWNWNNKEYSNIIIEGDDPGESENLKSLELSFKFVIAAGGIIESGISSLPDFQIISEDTEIDSKWFKMASTRMYVAIPTDSTASTRDIQDYNLFIHQYRNNSAEEMEFATIADQCPWLENKLIDFNYFLKQNIISKHEYQQIISYLQNDLRIINGKIMFYAKAYYEALHYQVKIISELTNDTDALGAAYSADIVDYFQRLGTINDNISNFDSAYTLLFQPISSQNRTPLFKYEELVSDYFSKSFDAEQRFLQNIYHFKKYFEEINTLGNDSNSCLFSNVLTAVPDSSSNEFITFNENHYESLSQFQDAYYDDVHDISFLPVLYRENNTQPLIAAELVTVNNYSNYYYPAINSSTIQPVTSGMEYNKKAQYFIPESLYTSLFGVVPQNRLTKEVSGVTYVKVLFNEMRNIYLYKNSDNYYIKDTDKRIPFDWIRISPAQCFNFFNNTAVPAFSALWQSILKNQFWEKYKNDFAPIDLYYYGANYELTAKANANTNVVSYELSRYNEQHQTLAQWQAAAAETDPAKKKDLLAKLKGSDPADYFCFQKISYVNRSNANVADLENLDNHSNDTNDESILEIMTYDNIQYANNKLKNNVASFYTFQRNDTAFGWAIASVALSALAILNPGPLFTLGNTIASAITLNHIVNDETWSNWIQNGRTERTFTPFPNGSTLDNCKHKWNSKKRSIEQGSVNTPTRGDSWYANYTTDASAMIQNLTYTRAYRDLLQYTDSPWTLTPVSQDTYQSNRNPLWQYFNYYQYIGATYSFETLVDYTTSVVKELNYFCNTRLYELTSNDQFYFKLWSKNEYIRFLHDMGDHLNLNDRYLLVPIAGTCRNITLDDWDNDSYDGIMKLYMNPWMSLPADKRISSVMFYPILNTASALELSYIKDKFANGAHPTLRTILEYIFQDDNTFEILSVNDASDALRAASHPSNWNTSGNISLPTVCYDGKLNQYFVIVHCEPFEKGIITGSYDLTDLGWGTHEWNEQTHTPTDYADFLDAQTNNMKINAAEQLFIDPAHYYINPLTLGGMKVYDLENDDIVDFTKKQDLLDITFADIGGSSSDIIYYYVIEEDADFVPITKAIWDQRHLSTTPEEFTHFYKKIATTTGVDFKRVYTISQLVDDASSATPSFSTNYQFISSGRAEIIGFKSNDTLFDVDIYINTIDNQTGALNIVGPFHQTIEIPYAERALEHTIHVTDVSGNVHDFVVEYSGEQIEPISKISNGEFWYRYHDRTEYAILFERAAAIESELSTYWTAAYTASKYCRFFLPEMWQVEKGEIRNGFANYIWDLQITVDPVDPSIKYLSGAQLKTTFIPEVEILTSTASNGTTTNILPRYQLHYWETPTLTYTTNQRLVNTNQSQLVKDTILSSSTDFIELLQWFNNNTMPLDVLLSHWTVEEYGSRTYYQVVSGGQYWRDLANLLGHKPRYPYYDGLYNMIYRLLVMKYTSRPSAIYESLVQQKQDLWRQLYQRYPGILLENNFSYEKALSSQDLLDAAKLAFKDQMEPERTYSIGILNNRYLNGYYGQELHIGDSILLNAKEYHDKPDDVFSAINQYMFISDLNYDLRNDNQISITVNSIKYQDKLIQSLAKLIR